MKKLTLAEKFNEVAVMTEGLRLSDGILVSDFMKDRAEKSVRTSKPSATRKPSKASVESAELANKVFMSAVMYFKQKGVDMASAHQLFEAVGLFDMSSQKQTAVMNVLIKQGKMEKVGHVTGDNGRSRVGYGLVKKEEEG